MLTAAEISAMRATQNLAMPDTGIIYRLVGTADGMGSYTEGTVAVGTVTGRLMPMAGYSSNERQGAAQPISVNRYWWTVPFDTTISADNLVVVSGQLLRVLEVNLDDAWETAKRCKVEAYNQGGM